MFSLKHNINDFNLLRYLEGGMRNDERGNKKMRGKGREGEERVEVGREVK